MFAFNRQLVYLKLFLLCHSGSVFSFWPFITLQGISAGVSMDQVAIVNLAAPLSSILGPFVSGIMADKIGNYKLLYVGFFLSLSATTWGFLALNRGTHLNSTDLLNSSIDCNRTCEADFVHQSDVSQFGMFFVLCMLVTLFGEGCYSLLDSITISVSSENKADMGKQRTFISLGTGIFPVLSGFIMDYSRDLNIKGLEGYSATTYLSTVMAFWALMAISRLNIRCVPQKKGKSSGLWSLLKQIDVACFLLAYVLTGSVFAFNSAFEFAYLNSLEAPSFLQGLPVSVGALISVIVLSISGKHLQKLGPPRTLMLVLTAWCIKFLGFSFLTNPWFALFGALLDSTAIPISFLSASSFCSQNAPPGLLATLTGVFNASFFGIGKAVGGSLGGALIHKYGFRLPYRVFGVAAGSTAVIYCLIYHLKLKSLEEKRLQKVVPRENDKAGHLNPAFIQEEGTKIKHIEDSTDCQHGGFEITRL